MSMHSTKGTIMLNVNAICKTINLDNDEMLFSEDLLK